MKYDNKLIEIVKKKKFKTFWHCLDYLILAGYTPMDAFGVSMLEFDEHKIYSNVAFIRLEVTKNNVMFTGENTLRPVKKPNFIVGIIDDTNIHLAGLYQTYREWLKNETVSSLQDMARELEATCEIIKITESTPFIADYLLRVSKLHFGYEAFKIPVKQTEIDVTEGINIRDREQVRRLLERHRPPQTTQPDEGDWQNSRNQAINRGIIDRADL